jgi:hypothetical protein
VTVADHPEGARVTNLPAFDGDTSRAPLGTWGTLCLLEEVGRGGFGVVYRAWEPVLEREVALKIIRPREPRAEAMDEVLREGQMLARVQHPNVVTLFGAQRLGDEVGLWMEFVHGRSLSDLVSRDGPLAAHEAAVIGISLCQALAAVHRAGVVHRDIKAQNVMRAAGGRIVLMDFGAGHLLGPSGATGEPAVGTPAYMAPEVLLGHRATAASDIYSLGVLLYYLVAGTFPVTGQRWSEFLFAHARAERQPLGDIRPDISAAFIRVVEQATALNPDERFQTPGALLRALTHAAVDSAAQTAATTPLPLAPAEAEPAAGGVTVDRRLVLGAGAAVGTWGLGAITSIVFNHTVGREGEFANETVLSWWVWGFRALLPGAVYALLVVMAWWAVAASGRWLTRVSPPVSRVVEPVSTRVSRIARRAGLDDPAARAQALLAGQVLAVAAFCWIFWDVFAAMTSFLASAPLEDLEALRPEHLARHQAYNLSMALLILAMGAATLAVRRGERRRGVPRRRTALVPNLVVIGVALVILVLPYRLMWHSDAEVAFYQGERCYVLAEAGASALLYCPSSPVPRAMKVSLVDSHVNRSGIVESFYTRPVPPAR